MCDFAADAAAAEQLMVGRTLSVARVRELNAKDYFYQMLKDNPEMLKISPGIENELLQGAIDCHIHAFPDFVHRSQDMIQIAIEASKCGMRAIAFKDHWNISATSAYLTQRHIDDMIARGELTNRVEVYGGVGMCFGMRPEYVRVGLQYPNFKMIWFPLSPPMVSGVAPAIRKKKACACAARTARFCRRLKRSWRWRRKRKSGSASAIPIFRNCCRWAGSPKISG